MNSLPQEFASCDEYYANLQREMSDPDARLVQRQALAGMIWSKQRYAYNVQRWLDGDDRFPEPPASRLTGRNQDWTHVNGDAIFSMPDKWEYPWFAAWDLAFHTVTFALIDPEFAKQQLIQLGHVWYLHPNGQLPAYEWNFADANPPVHAWASYRVFQIDRKQKRAKDPDYPGDLVFLERIFQKLVMNFTWWVNQKDSHGRNLFQGGFLGLDNIGAFNRDEPLPDGGYLSQSDGTSWMAMYSLNLMRIAIELAQHDHVYEDMATKFFEHFLYIAKAMTDMGGKGVGLWNEEDSFYYDVLNLPDGQTFPLKVRSMVGLMPLVRRRDSRARVSRQHAGFQTAHGVVPAISARHGKPGFALERSRSWRAPLAFAPARTSHEGPVEADARPRGVSFRLRRALALAISRRPSLPTASSINWDRC